ENKTVLKLVILSAAGAYATASQRIPRVSVVTMQLQGVLPKQHWENALMPQSRRHCTGILRLARAFTRATLRTTVGDGFAVIRNRSIKDRRHRVFRKNKTVLELVILSAAGAYATA